MRRSLFAFFLASVATFAVLAPTSANAVATQTTGALSTTAWTDLGAGPMRLFGGGHTRYAISDSTPATVTLGFEIGDTPTDVNTTSHVWVISANPNYSTFATYAPITAGGSGGGGGAATIADGADVAEGATTDTSSALTLIGLTKAVKASVANIGASPMQATGGSVTANAGTNLNTSLLATDAHLLALTTALGAAPAQQTGQTVALVAGSAIVGKFGIDQTTPGTTNAVVSKAGVYTSAASSQDQLGLSITSVTTLTVPSGATGVTICIEGAAARYTIDGQTPSLTVGIPLPIGCYPFAITLSQFKFFGATGATLDASYVK